MKPFKLRKGTYTTPDSAYKRHSYVMNPKDREFITNIFTNGVGIYACPTHMRALYIAMRTRCILFKKDPQLKKAVKIAVRDCDVVGWSLAKYAIGRMTPDLVQRAKDFGWVTQWSEVEKEDIDGLEGKVARLLGEAKVLESEEDIRAYVLERIGREEEKGGEGDEGDEE